MLRLTAVFIFGALLGGRLLAIHTTPSEGISEETRTPLTAIQGAIRNVRGLIAAARGLPPVVCGLTAEAAAGWGGRFWSNAPSPPLGAETSERVASFPRGRLTLTEVSLLIDSLATPDPCVREIAVRLVGRVDAALVEDRLITRLGGQTAAPTREAAALGLGLVESKLAVDPLLRSVRDSEIGVRANSIWALGRIGEQRVAPSLRAILSDEEDLVRNAAVGALGQLEDANSIEELLRVLRTDRVPAVRRTAAWALGQIEAREAADGLASALRNERDDDVREMIVWALGNIESASAVGALIDVLRRDTNAEVREQAAWALGEIEDGSAVAALGEAAGSDADAGVRGTAAWAIGQIEPSEAPRGLIRAVTDTDADVRTRAAWALSEMGDSSAIGALRQAMRAERSATARKAQLRALIRAGERSEEFFRELLRSDDAEVRAAAVRGMAGRHSNPWPWPQPRPRPFP
jgi:HEAT repeat protein